MFVYREGYAYTLGTISADKTSVLMNTCSGRYNDEDIPTFISSEIFSSGLCLLSREAAEC